MTEREGERLRLEFERERFERELELRRQELEIRRQEVKANAAAKTTRWPSLSTLIGGITVAALGLVGTWFTAYYQGRNSLQLEAEELRSQIILKAIEADDAATSARNLLFFSELGLIALDPKNIRRLTEEPEQAPVLRAGPGIQVVREFHLKTQADSGVVELKLFVDSVRIGLQDGSADVRAPSGTHTLSWFVIGAPGSTFAIELSDGQKALLAVEHSIPEGKSSAVGSQRFLIEPG